MIVVYWLVHVLRVQGWLEMMISMIGALAVRMVLRRLFRCLGSVSDLML